MNVEQDFADLKFRIECHHMVLTQAGGAGLVVHGPGEIWQDEEGDLQFKIFVDEAGYRGLQNYAGRPTVIGQPIPDDDFFSLEAREYDSPVWTAQRIIPSFRGRSRDGLAYGEIHELVQAESIQYKPQSDIVALRLKGKIKFPCNLGTQTEIRVGGQLRHADETLNAAFVEDDDYKFKANHEGEHTLLWLELPPGQLTSATPSRIHEALQFILGEQIAVMVVSINVGGQLVTRLTSPSRGHGRMPPPLQFLILDEGGHIWRMFTNYFRYIHSNTEPRWHPISRHIGAAIESMAASENTQVLALGVAVEGLVGECFSTIAPVSSGLLVELDAAENALAFVQLAGQTRARIKGAIGQLRRPRNSDLLRAFVTNNGLPNGLLNSWSSLRNTSAHGGGAGGRDIETVLRLKSEVLSLAYSIVFAAINYAGPRTDYSLLGWPTRAWPVPQSAPQPETTPAPPSSANQASK